MEEHADKYLKSKAWEKAEDNPSARAFDREKDVLGGRRMDHRKREDLVKQSMELGSKFSRSSGRSDR